MDALAQALQLLFGEDPEMRQIVAVTLRMSFTSVTISALVGLTLGYLIGSRDFPAKRFILRANNTLMGLPPVVAGLFVFLLLSASGPLGKYRLLYTVTAMVIAQVVLITPIICGLSIPVFGETIPLIRETVTGLGLSRRRQFFLCLSEAKGTLMGIVIAGFGRAIAEVGAVTLVGGNIQFKTRVMTTAIMLETNMGNFHFALALGIVLLVISFVINIFAAFFQERD